MKELSIGTHEEALDMTVTAIVRAILKNPEGIA